MRERVRIFTDTTGTHPTAIEPHLEDEINEWLAATPGQFLYATQSECASDNSHLTVCIWYLAEEGQRGEDANDDGDR